MGLSIVLFLFLHVATFSSVLVSGGMVRKRSGFYLL